jgi:hypothetical protein
MHIIYSLVDQNLVERGQSKIKNPVAYISEPIVLFIPAAGRIKQYVDVLLETKRALFQHLFQRTFHNERAFPGRTKGPSSHNLQQGL